MGVSYESIEKTVVRNELRQYSVDRIVRGKVGDDLTKWKETVSTYSYDAKSLKTSFDKVVAEKDWKWIPGKEGLGIALSLEPKFWNKLKQSVGIEKFNEIVLKDASVKKLVNNLSTKPKSRDLF